MKLRKTAAITFAACALVATAACGKEGSPQSEGTADGDRKGSDAPQLPAYEVKENVNLDGSSVFDRIKGKKITIGVKADQPGLGFKDPGSGERSGFDIEIAKMVAADLGFSANEITWKDVPSEARETQLSSGGVDLYVGTYTINDERKKQVGFAGPYYIAGQDLLVKADSDIKSTDDLKGKTVCSATGSTSLERIKDPKYGAKTKAQQTYQTCVQALTSGSIDAVTTDDAILKGYAAQNAGALKVIGKPFSKEPYGIGLAKNDKVLRDAVNDALENHEKNGDWKKAYDATLGLSGAGAEPPAIERY